MRLSKLECYSKLFEIKSKGVDILPIVALLAGKDEVPEEVIEFISDNSEVEDDTDLTNDTDSNHANTKDDELVSFIEDLRVSGNKSKSKVFKSIMSESTDTVSKLKALSSIITRAIINSESKENKKLYYDSLNLSELTESLKEYFDTEDESKLDSIISVYRSAYIDRGESSEKITY